MEHGLAPDNLDGGVRGARTSRIEHGALGGQGPAVGCVLRLCHLGVGGRTYRSVSVREDAMSEAMNDLETIKALLDKAGIPYAVKTIEPITVLSLLDGSEFEFYFSGYHRDFYGVLGSR